LDGRTLVMDLEGRTFRFPLSEEDAGLLKEGEPRGTLTLEGDRIYVPLGGLERVVVPVTAEDREFLTRGASAWRKARQAVYRFLTHSPSSEATQAGVLSPLVGTLLVMLVTLLTAVPLGVAAGVYLEEYGRKNWVTTVIEINISNLAGVPSILYG